jgi:PHD/YefM family antitoxin component YafN of YafNO toxin-antitoxin module
METVPQIVPISQMRLDQAAVLEQMDQAPVILAARSQPRAVLVSVEQWNEMVDRLKQLEQWQRARIADAHFEQMRAGDYVELTAADIEAM